MLTLRSTRAAFSCGLERQVFLAGASFLELAATEASLEIHLLAQWFEEHVAPNICSTTPVTINEPGVGHVALHPDDAGRRWANAHAQRVVNAARGRVLQSLRALITSPTDDRFLREAIFVGRVIRQSGRWVARPEATAPLSAIVLSLFAVSILSDRNLYDRQLCICGVCGRVSFDPSSLTRATCDEHPAATLIAAVPRRQAAVSGFTAGPPVQARTRA